MRPLLDPYNPHAGGLLGGGPPQPELGGLLGAEGLIDPPRYSPFPLRMWPPAQTEEDWWNQFHNDQLYRGWRREDIPERFRPPLEVPDLDPVFPEWPPSYLR